MRFVVPATATSAASAQARTRFVQAAAGCPTAVRAAIAGQVRAAPVLAVSVFYG